MKSILLMKIIFKPNLLMRNDPSERQGGMARCLLDEAFRELTPAWQGIVIRVRFMLDSLKKCGLTIDFFADIKCACVGTRAKGMLV